MSGSVLARRQRPTAQVETSPLRPAVEPANNDPRAASVSSAGHTLGGFAIQRCGPVPCDCAEGEGAAYEAEREAHDEHDHASGHAAGHASGGVQRAPDDTLPSDGGGIGGSSLGGNGSSDAIPLAGGANGSTTIHPPTHTTTDYSGQTLADVESLFPAEVGSVTFDMSVSSSGDPITSARLDVTQVMMMPRWLEYSRQCAPVQRAWDSFYSALRSHENGHVTIDNQQFAGKHARFIGKAQSDTQTESDALRADVQAVHDAYDHGNQHGVTGNPPTILDTSVTCPPKPTSADLGASDLGESVASDGSGNGGDTTGTMQAMQAAAARDEASGIAAPVGEVASRVRSVVGSGGGQPLDDTTRAFMEPRFSHDFSRVRVHTDEQAARSATSARALAYTVGSDIVFAAGRYAPQTNAGRHLLAHELTHVMQQSAGPVAGTTLGDGLTISDPSDSYEQAAEATAHSVMSEGGQAATKERRQRC